VKTAARTARPRAAHQRLRPFDARPRGQRPAPMRRAAPARWRVLRGGPSDLPRLLSSRMWRCAHRQRENVRWDSVGLRHERRAVGHEQFSPRGLHTHSRPTSWGRAHARAAQLVMIDRRSRCRSRLALPGCHSACAIASISALNVSACFTCCLVSTTSSGSAAPDASGHDVGRSRSSCRRGSSRRAREPHTVRSTCGTRPSSRTYPPRPGTLDAP